MTESRRWRDVLLDEWVEGSAEGSLDPGGLAMLQRSALWQVATVLDALDGCMRWIMHR